MTHRWSEDQNRLLIRLVSQRPCLWQKNNPHYQVKQIKDENWVEIDQVLGTNGACRRFKSLRDDFTRYSKGSRGNYQYVQDMAFLRGEIGHRGNSLLNNSRNSIDTQTRNSVRTNSKDTRRNLLADTTIELLESEESDGLYEEVDDDEVHVEQPVHVQTTIPAHLHSIPIDPAVAQQIMQQTRQNKSHTTGTSGQQEGSVAKKARIGDTASSSMPETDWQAPVDNTNITREDYQYCKTLISAMSVLPTSKQRELKAEIYSLVVQKCNNYEASQNFKTKADQIIKSLAGRKA